MGGLDEDGADEFEDGAGRGFVQKKGGGRKGEEVKRVCQPLRILRRNFDEVMSPLENFRSADGYKQLLLFPIEFVCGKTTRAGFVFNFRGQLETSNCTRTRSLN